MHKSVVVKSFQGLIKRITRLCTMFGSLLYGIFFDRDRKTERQSDRKKKEKIFFKGSILSELLFSEHKHNEGTLFPEIIS